MQLPLESWDETSRTNSQGLIWSGLSVLNQAACLLLWCFCLRMCIRGRDLSALHPHTLQECLVGLGALLFVACIFAAYLRSTRLRRDSSHRLETRGTILPCSLSPYLRRDSQPDESADQYATVPDVAEPILSSFSPSRPSRLGSKSVESPEECTTAQNLAGSILSSFSPSRTSRLDSKSVESPEKFATAHDLAGAILSSFTPSQPSRLDSKPAESPEKYTSVHGGNILSRLFGPSKLRPRKVKFSVTYTTVPGENLFVVGSSMELGAWDVSRSVPMQWTDGNVWVAKVDINPAPGRVEYKYVVRSDQTLVWENGVNHAFDATKAKEGVLNCRSDAWGIV
jgi:hypothetical protein